MKSYFLPAAFVSALPFVSVSSGKVDGYLAHILAAFLGLSFRVGAFFPSREKYAHNGPLPLDAPHRYFSVMEADKLRYYRKPEPDAAFRARSRALRTIKRFEDAEEVFSRDAYAGIANGQFYEIRVHRFDGYRNVASARGGPDGVF